MPKRFLNNLIIFGLSVFTQAVYSNTTPGILESLKTIVNLERENFSINLKESQKNTLRLDNLDGIKDINLSTEFLESLLIFSNKNYLHLLSEYQECSFYSLLENDLLKTAKGIPSSYIVKLKRSNNKTEIGSMSKSVFFNILYSKKCLTNIEIKKLFSLKNIKTTFKNIKFKAPKTDKECLEQYNNYLSNPYTPSLCKVSKILKDGEVASLRSGFTGNPSNQLKSKINISKRYEDNIDFFERNFIKNLCSNLNSSEKFCSNYLTNNTWKKIATGEIPEYKIKYKCQNLLKNYNDLDKKLINRCIQQFTSSIETCRYKTNDQFPSLFPSSDCNEQGKALQIGRLITKYKDCPGRVDNEGITNIYRILNHFFPTDTKSNPTNCSSNSNLSFANLNFEFKNEDAWPMRICYINKATEKEVCTKYVPGTLGKSTYSEEQIISDILYKSYGAPSKLKCKITSTKKYSPTFLGYSTGCFILYNPDNCTSLNCPKKIIYKNKEIKGITFKGEPTFEYFPSSFSNEKYSIVNILKETKKLTQKLIRNRTELEFYFKQNKNAIIHGIGCAEDLHPTQFRKLSFNQCSPLPFIIDGYDKKSKNVVLRSAVADIHSPLMLRWNYIFSAVASYKELHPLKTWTLYGIK